MAREDYLYNVVIYDEIPISRIGLKTILGNSRVLFQTKVYETDSVQNFVLLMESKSIDVVYMDYFLLLRHAKKLTNLASLSCRFKLIVTNISRSNIAHLLNMMVSGGIQNFVFNDEDPIKIVSDLLSVLNSQECFKFSNTVISDNGGKNRMKESVNELLSKREMEVLELLCKDLSNSEISEKLFISTKTVEWHKCNLIKKTGVKNVTGLVVWSFQNKVVELSDSLL